MWLFLFSLAVVNDVFFKATFDPSASKEGGSVEWGAWSALYLQVVKHIE